MRTNARDRTGGTAGPLPLSDDASGALGLDALVLDAGSRQSLVTVRSLGRRGLSVGAMETHRDAAAFRSRWCSGRFVSSGGYGTDAYLGDMEGVLEQTEVPLIIPAHDGTISLLRRHRDRVLRSARIAMASEPAMALAVNKARTLAVADRLGIAVPSGVLVEGLDGLPSAVEEVGLPAVIKPCESWVGPEGQGARVVPRVVTTPEEVTRAFSDLTRLGGAVLVQNLLPGRREAVSLMYAGGEVHARFAQWAQRTVPPLGGDSVLRQSIPVPPDIGEQAESLVRQIELEGYSEVEFRRGADGVAYLMEINPRLSASVEVAVRSGVDFPFLIKQWADGEAIETVRDYRTGVWMRYLGGDVRGTVETVRQRGRPGITPPSRALRDFCLAFLRPMGYDYFEWADPLPALQATAGFVGHRMSRVLRGDEPSPGRNVHGRRGDDEEAPTVRARRAI